MQQMGSLKVSMDLSTMEVEESENETDIALPPTPELVITAVSLSAIILGTIVGNVLVIISVFNYRPLRNVQNMFLVSLAIADITVAVLVMPLNVAYAILGKWIFGLRLCEMWLTCDVLCCTASILNLCAIALDRYWAIHDPINYARKRTLNRVLLMIMLVWVISTLISVPPLIGWNDWPENFTEETPCQLTEERGYVIYSASGSFFIPLVIMTTVYIKVFQAAKHRIRVKAKAAANLGNSKMEGPSMPLKSVATESSNLAITEDSTSSSTSPCNNQPSSTKQELSVPVPTAASCKSCASNISSRSNQRTRGRDSKFTATLRHYMREKQKICLLKERRAARVLGIVMGVFVLSWLPFFLMYVILPFCHGCHVSQRLMNFITWLGYVNSALNPVIYTVFNIDFRKAFAILLCGRR